ISAGMSRALAGAPARNGASHPKAYPVPTLFEGSEEWEEEPFPLPLPPTAFDEPQPSARGYEPQKLQSSLLSLAGRAGEWVRSVTRSLLPERSGGASASSVGVGSLVVPARLLIAAGLVVVIGVLAFSVYGMTRGA